MMATTFGARSAFLALACISICTAQANLPSFSKVGNAPQDTPTRTSAFTVGTSLTQSAMFIGGTDADKNNLATTTTVIPNGVTSPGTPGAFTISTAVSAFIPFKGATPVVLDINGIAVTTVYSTYMIGGLDTSGQPSMNVAVYDHITTSWTASMTTTVTSGQPAPAGRTGAAAAYLARCDMSTPSDPKPCILVFGGQSSSGLLNDLWALWITETTPRWERITSDTATPEPGRPSRRVNAVGAPSGAGDVMYVYGGITSTGATADVFALAPAGFPDPVYPTEMVNVGVNSTARQSTQLAYWGDRGPGAAVDGNLRTDFDASGHPFACTHTTDEASPWWQTRLNQTTNVDAVRISPRSDCCVDRSRQYSLFTSLSDPNNGPPPDTARVLDPMPNLAGAPVLVLFSTPRPTLFLWVQLNNLGYNRALTLCEVEILVKKKWVWRQLSGIGNVALQKDTDQSSFLTDWSGGDPSRAVDGITTTNYNAAPASCSHTAGVPANNKVWWQVDLGQVYRVVQLRLWTRMDCCTARNTNWFIHVGNSRGAFIFDPIFASGNMDTTNAAKGRIFDNVAKGRFVTVRRSNLLGGEDSIITICELQVMAELLPNQPAPVRDFASVIFRGNLVVYGGTDTGGFRVPDIRFFNLNTRTWAAAFEPLGTGPGARAFHALTVLDANRLLTYGGTSASDVMSDMSVLTFPVCPALDLFTGVASYRCEQAGTSCIVTCNGGFTDQNNGDVLVCREDGIWDGITPPCVPRTPLSSPAITGLTVPIKGTGANSSVVVSWSVSNTAIYTPFGGLKGWRVTAEPIEFLETFENGFVNPGAWKQYNSTVQTASFWYFKNGKLFMDAGAGTDYWAWSMLENIATTGIVVQDCCNVRIPFMLYRDWPSNIDVEGEWAIETQLTAEAMPSGSGVVMGLLDLGLVPGRGEAQFFWGYRYTDGLVNGATLTLAFESLGGRTSRIFPALSDSVYLRLEKVRFSPEDTDFKDTDHGVIRAYYKYTAGAKWVRVYDTLTYRETIGTYYNASACGSARAPNCIDGPGMRWKNIRPYFYAKSWNNNLYARALGSFGFLKITQGTNIVTQPQTRFLPHPPVAGVTWTHNTTQLLGLTAGVTYNIRVQAVLDSGLSLYKTNDAITASERVSMPPPRSVASNVVLGTREIAMGKNTFASAEAYGGLAVYGNDGVWLGNMMHAACNGGLGDWWGVDLGVDYAAATHIVVRNRCENANLAQRARHFNIYMGQDGTGPWNTNQRSAQTVWDNYTMSMTTQLYRQNNIPNVPVRTMWTQSNLGVNQQWVPYTYSTSAWNSDPALCRTTLPITDGTMGRYLYFTNSPGQCLHFTELQVFAYNSCPARSSWGDSEVVTDGGQRCTAGTPFGRQCEHRCTQGSVQLSGDRVVTCNGRMWTGGFASEVVCGRQCIDIEAPPMAALMEHEIFNEDMQTWFKGQTTISRQRVAALDPVNSPLATTWSYAEGGVQSLGRLGTPVEPALVWTVSKIARMDSTGQFAFSATFSTSDRAGLLWRVVDNRNYYRVYIDVASGYHVAEAIVDGVPRTMVTTHLPLRASVPYTLAVLGSGFDFNITLNGRIIMQGSDRQFPQGYPGIYAQSTALFTNAKYSRFGMTCAGATQTERCIVTCGAGLTNRGSPLIRTCSIVSSNTQWNINPATNPTKCTLDPPTFPPAQVSVRENSARNTLVGAPLVAQSTSPDYPVQFQLLAIFAGDATSSMGTDLFSVDFCTGQVKVRQSNALDFELMPTYSLLVRAYVTGFTDAFMDRNVTVQLLDVDEPPIIIQTTLVYPENITADAIVGRVQWWDPENDTAIFSVDVDGSGGRFMVEPITQGSVLSGQVRVVAQPSNSSGFPSLGTGPQAPLSFEGLGASELPITVTATQLTCLRVPCATTGATALTGSGSVIMRSDDMPDAPYFGAATQVIRVDQATASTVNGVVGIPTVMDEDQGQWGSEPSFAQVDPNLCGVPPANTYFPFAVYPAVQTGSLSIGTNNLFDVDPTTGQITVARALPAGRDYADFSGSDDYWAVYVYNNVLSRAVYRVCIRATDGNVSSLATTAAVEVLVRADIPTTPKADSISPALFPTDAVTMVTIAGVNFQVGQQVSAWYGNGVNSYNATGCIVFNSTQIRCNTVLGVGGSMVWYVTHNNRPLLSESALMASYMAPSISTVTGFSNMPTAGSVVTIDGRYFGPADATNVITVVYGTAYEIPCQVTLQSQTQIQCRSSGEHGGRNLPYKIIIGTQEATTTDLWSYGAPTIVSIMVMDAMGRLNTAGGTVIEVNGTNFGGNTVNADRGLVTSFGSNTGKLVDLPCIKPSAATPHTSMTCTVPAGAGRLHAVMVEVFGVAMTAPYGSLAYYPPVISNIIGPGYSNADTSGGQLITITGSHFGPLCFGRGTCQQLILPGGVTYGSDGDSISRYSAVNCQITRQQSDATGEVQCLSNEGVGKNMRYTMTVADQAINNTGSCFPETGSSYKLGSYSPPNIAAFAGTGSYDADTRGGQPVVITGRNFGPADAYTNALLYVTYGADLQTDIMDSAGRVIIGNVTYQAATCTITKPHTELTCNTAEGAGTQLDWNVVVAGQKSASPTTAYAAPVIETITYDNGQAVTDANVDGGEWVVLTGDFFGPLAYSTTLRSLVQSVSYGPYGTEYPVPETDWQIQGHNKIRARLQPGSGENLVFRVVVADQVSTSKPGATFSYGKPLIVAILPGGQPMGSRAPTFSDPRQPVIVTVQALNLPLRDSRSRVAIQYANANVRLLTPVVPQGADAIARARNPDGSVNISFTLPTHGGGLMQQVRIAILPSTSNVPSQLSVLTPATTLSYRDPVIRDIVVTKARFSDNATANMDLMPCPFKNGPAPWSCDDPDLYQLSLEGTDFSSDLSDMTTRILERGIDGLDAFGGVTTIWSQAPLWRVSWDHSRIVAFTVLRGPKTGNLRINITSVSFDRSLAYQGAQRAFVELSPDIGSIVGADSPFPTTGGSIDAPIILELENLDNARDLKIQVGDSTPPRYATLLQKTGTTYTPITTAAAAQAWVAANKDSVKNTWTVYAQVPAGQGTRQMIRVIKTTATGDQGSNSPVFINYLPPVLTEAAVVRGGVEQTPRIPAQIINNVVVPTDGSVRVRLYGTNLGVDPAIIVGDGFRLSGSAVWPCSTVPANSHTCYEFQAVPGEGDGFQHLLPPFQTREYPLGYRLFLEASDQDSLALGWRYEAPVVSSVVSSTGIFPTRGGVSITLTGKNFGETKLGRPLSTIVAYFGRMTDPEADWQAQSCVAVRISHTTMNCTLPEGSGRLLAVRLTVAGLLGLTLDVFSYARPSVQSISVMAWNGNGTVNSTMEASLTYPVSHGRTAGSDVMTIIGANFGRATIYQDNTGAWRNGAHCAFFQWAYRTTPDDPVCNDREDYLGEGEIPASNIISWSHELIVLRTPQGLGAKDIELSIRGRLTEVPRGSANVRRFKYSAPVISGLWERNVVQPMEAPVTSFDTEGNETVTMFGDNFGPALYPGKLDSNVFDRVTVPLDTAQRLPMAQIALVFHRQCISNSKTVTGGKPDMTVPLVVANQAQMARNLNNPDQCVDYIASQDHGRLVFRTGAGIGRNRTFYMVVLDGPEVIWSNKLTFDYKAPEIQSFGPDVMLMKGTFGQNLDIKGRYFGNRQGRIPIDQGWTDEEKDIKVVIGGLDKACVGPGVDRFGNPAPDSRRQGTDPEETIVMCSVDQTIMPAGIRNVSLTVAGQTGRKEAIDEYQSLVMACAPGYFGHIGEICLPCPVQSDDPMRTGADCPGFNDGAGWRSVHKPGVVYPTFAERFRYPVPRKGWYNLNSSDAYTAKVDGNPSMLDACPDGQRGVPEDTTRDLCIVPCDPPESCTGDNHCAEGYTSKPPMWRCASCDKGYYKRSGECVKCPDSPAALFIGFILLVIAAAGIGFALNRKQINIAVLSIGVDFFQVLAIFAQARVKWPPVVKELLHVLSAFNLNIEIVAPECLIPDVSYKQKFWFIMLLPLCIAGLFGLNYLGLLVYKAVIQGQPKKMWHTHKPALVSSCLVLLYLLYLYLTRTIFDVFNCGPTFPPDGKQYLQVVFEECGIPGGTQMTLMGYAIAGLIVYTAGYPLFIGWTLFKNRELVMEDQLLRAKGVGNDKLSNPRAYDFRITYGRSYFQFKPDWCLWILAIILRKFFIAITAVVFGKNSSFQMAACLLIMFLAYAAQVQIRPYMSPGDFDEVLRTHTEASYVSAIHARLRASLAGIESRGRKKAHKNLINFEGKVDRTAVFGVLTGFFFNYNTVEAIMTFSAVIVCLMAIMYQANELNSYYPQSRDSVTSVVLIIVIWAIVYFFTVFITEIVVLYNEDVRAKQLAKAARNARLDKGGKKAAGDEDAGARRAASSDVEVNVGKVETQANPMFINSGSGNQGSVSAADVSSTILSQRDAPPVELWRVFQQAFADLQSANSQLQDQLLATKKALQTGGGMGDEPTTTTMKRGGAKTEFAPKASEAQVNPLLGKGKQGVSLAAARKSVSTHRSVDSTSSE